MWWTREENATCLYQIYFLMHNTEKQGELSYNAFFLSFPYQQCEKHL